MSDKPEPDDRIVNIDIALVVTDVGVFPVVGYDEDEPVDVAYVLRDRCYVPPTRAEVRRVRTPVRMLDAAEQRPGPVEHVIEGLGDAEAQAIIDEGVRQSFAEARRLMRHERVAAEDAIGSGLPDGDWVVERRGSRTTYRRGK